MEHIWGSARYGQLDCIQTFLKIGVDINLKDEYGNTALIYACKYSNTISNIETLKLLLEHGADVNLQDRDGDTPLIYACRYSNTTSNIETLKLLLEHGADPNIQNEYGYTSLMIASQYSNDTGNIEPVKLLLEHGADLHLQNKEQCTALMYASQYSNTTSNLETVKLLINASHDKNFNVNLSEVNGTTALMFACKVSCSSSSLETVQLLISQGADVNRADNKGNTALMYACFHCKTFDEINWPNNINFSCSNLETVKLLINSGSSIDFKDHKGNTALTYANNLETVLYLLTCGASPFIKISDMRCEEIAASRAIAKVAWQKLYKTDLRTAQILGKSCLNRDIWQLILMNNRQIVLTDNNSKIGKYILEYFAMQLGASEKDVINMDKMKLAGLISRNIGRSNEDAEIELKRARILIKQKTQEIKELAKKLNINTDNHIWKIFKNILERI